MRERERETSVLSDSSFIIFDVHSILSLNKTFVICDKSIFPRTYLVNVALTNYSLIARETLVNL